MNCIFFHESLIDAIFNSVLGNSLSLGFSFNNSLTVILLIFSSAILSDTSTNADALALITLIFLSSSSLIEFTNLIKSSSSNLLNAASVSLESDAAIAIIVVNVSFSLSLFLAFTALSVEDIPVAALSSSFVVFVSVVGAFFFVLDSVLGPSTILLLIIFASFLETFLVDLENPSIVVEFFACFIIGDTSFISTF